jgi:hypothetical protein
MREDERERKSESDGEKEMRYNRCQHLFSRQGTQFRVRGEVNYFCLTTSAVLKTEAVAIWDGEEAAK